MKRTLSPFIKKDLKKKPVLLSGPRQCGKTFLAKRLFDSYDYSNFDVVADRKMIISQDWLRNRDLVIFDELHKMKKWKSWLKGIFDSNEKNQKYLVTGSANLNTYKKVGDSLAGRYLGYRLYPFDLKELIENIDTLELKIKKRGDIREHLFERLFEVSGFPEPFLTKEKGFYQKWCRTHLDVILKQDVLEMESVKNIKQIETLTYLLTERVGSPLSYNSLREDVGTDDKSIKRWVDLLENSYVLFRIYPYKSRSIAGSLRKAPKVYFYDHVRVENHAARLENMVAFALQKEIHFRQDALGENFDLFYVRNKQKKEIDFLITKNKKPHRLIEVKTSDVIPSENFQSFSKAFVGVPKIQLVRNLDHDRLTKEDVLVTPVYKWLSQMDF